MQTIGLIGGMSWESSAAYYRALNLGVMDRLGGYSSPKLVLATVDFAELNQLEDEDSWDQIGTLLADAARSVERAGADFFAMCTTTFHKVADQVSDAVGIPMLRLGDVVAEAVKAAGVEKVGLLGTRVVMEGSFFVDRLSSHGVQTVVPAAQHHQMLDDAIYKELVHGRVKDTTRRKVVELIPDLWDAGAGGILLGCSELELLVKQADSELPLFPCTTLHVNAILDRALA